MVYCLVLPALKMIQPKTRWSHQPPKRAQSEFTDPTAAPWPWHTGQGGAWTVRPIGDIFATLHGDSPWKCMGKYGRLSVGIGE
jgi:hypothetical protein